MRSIPNILSIFRICLTPVFIVTYFLDGLDTRKYALLVYALASFTDFLDGFLARRFQASSKLGKFLDPFADKLMTVSALVCITIDGLIPVWAVIVTVVKEVMMATGGLIVRRKTGAEIPPSNLIGKTSTVVFFLVCAALMLFGSIERRFAVIMISAAVALTIAALISYFVTYINIMKNLNNKQQEPIEGLPHG